ncbi:MAG: hypothetical protein K2W94_05680 [Alphaproteobacteria bacterium]|nr:hypothetical protein [Alphaproteobacteria bacterium]
MNKRLLICALLSIGQFVYASSYGFASALTETFPVGGDGGGLSSHRHKVYSPLVTVGSLPKSPSYIHVESFADLTDGLSKGTSPTISIQLMTDFALSDALTGASYSSIHKLNIGSGAKLVEGDLTRIVSAFPNLTSLIVGDHAASISSEELATELPKLIRIQELNIDGASVTDEVVEALVPVAGTLHTLHLNHASLTGASAETLKRFKNLVHLNTLGTRAILKAQADVIKDAIPALRVKGAFKRNAF